MNFWPVAYNLHFFKLNFILNLFSRKLTKTKVEELQLMKLDVFSLIQTSALARMWIKSSKNVTRTMMAKLTIRNFWRQWASKDDKVDMYMCIDVIKGLDNEMKLGGSLAVRLRLKLINNNK